MVRRKRSSSSGQKPIKKGKQSEELIDSIIDSKTEVLEEELYRSKNCYKNKNYCAEICCKLENIDSINFACANDKDLLISIICMLTNKEYGLKALEHKIGKSQDNEDIKNIKSITDLLERAIAGLGETAIGAVKKAVEAAGTISDLTSGLAKIASGTAGTAGSIAQTANGLATVAAGTAGTAGAAGIVAAETAGLAAVGAVTAGAVADIAGETVGIASAGAATAGAVADIAGETVGIASAGAATAGAAAEITAQTAGVAAAGAATAGAAAEIAAQTAGIAAAGAATAGAAAEITAQTAGIAAAGAATAGAAADITAKTAGIAAAGAATAGAVAEVTAQTANSSSVSDAGIQAEQVTTGLIEISIDEDTIQIYVLNINSITTGAINITLFDLSAQPKADFYIQSSEVPLNNSVVFTVASVPALCEVQIKGLTPNMFAYVVAINGKKEGLKSENPKLGRIIYMYPETEF